MGHAGSDNLDASLLLLAWTGFLGGRDRRFAQTIRAIRAELAAVRCYRFSGAKEFEGAFVACSFWLVDELVRNGRAAQARKLWRQLLAHTSDLGLLAEEIDPATGAFLGNLPQGCRTWPCSTRPLCSSGDRPPRNPSSLPGLSV